MSSTCEKCGAVVSLPTDRCQSCGHLVHPTVTTWSTQPYSPADRDSQPSALPVEPLADEDEAAKVQRLLGRTRRGRLHGFFWRKRHFMGVGSGLLLR
jgi:hypothetical protein